MSDEQVFSKVCRLLDGLKEEMIEIQVKLTSLPALGPENGGRGEWERARFLEKYILNRKIGEVVHLDAPDERVPEKTRPNLLVRLRGKKQRPTLWVMAHLDVVPAGDETQWQTPPFEAVVKDGRIYGRGTEDNQQGMVSALFALRALSESGVRPPSDVVLMLVSDEETGSKYGVEYILEKHSDLFQPGDLVIVPDAGSPDGSAIEVAEKSILWVKFEITGKQVHASTPHLGTNALRAAAHLITALDSSLHQKFADSDEVFDPPQSTFEPTKHEANVPNVNTVPGKEVFYLDCRVLPRHDLNSIKAVLKEHAELVEKQFQVKVDVSYPNEAQAAPPTAADSQVVVRLARAIRKVRGVEPRPIGIGGGTVAALFRRKGLPAVVWGTLEDLAHQPNEFCVIENLASDAKVFSHLFMNA